MMNHDEIYEKAVDFFGDNSQKIKAIEELSEFQKEICKDLNNQGDSYAIAEEFADVEIMMNQMEIILSKQIPNFDETVEQIRNEKLKKLGKFLEKNDDSDLEAKAWQRK